MATAAAAGTGPAVAESLSEATAEGRMDASLWNIGLPCSEMQAIEKWNRPEVRDYPGHHEGGDSYDKHVE